MSTSVTIEFNINERQKLRPENTALDEAGEP
jgi:hypothetical protein